MEVLDLPDLHICADEAEVGIGILMSKAEPSWPKTNTAIKAMVYGNQSCLLWKCYLDSSPDKAYVVRVFPDKTQPMKDYGFEMKALKVLSSYDHFTKLKATFKNGVCYHYSEGVPFTVELPNAGVAECIPIDDEKLRLIAERLVTIHRIQIPDEDYTKSTYFDKLMKVMDKTYPEESGEFPSKASLKDLVVELRTEIEKLALPIVFCHGDYQMTNFLWNERTKTVIPIDWEMSHIGYRAWDIAYILEKMKILSELFNYRSKLTDDYRNKFLKFYFSYDCELNGKSVDEFEFQRFTKEVNIFAVVSSLFYLSVSVDVVLKFPNPPDVFREYILNWMDYVMKNKDRVFKEYPK